MEDMPPISEKDLIIAAGSKRGRGEEGEIVDEPALEKKVAQEENKKGEDEQIDLVAADVFDGLNVSSESNMETSMQEHCKRVLANDYYKEATSQIMQKNIGATLKLIMTMGNTKKVGTESGNFAISMANGHLNNTIADVAKLAIANRGVKPEMVQVPEQYAHTLDMFEIFAYEIKMMYCNTDSDKSGIIDIAKYYETEIEKRDPLKSTNNFTADKKVAEAVWGAIDMSQINKKARDYFAFKMTSVFLSQMHEQQGHKFQSYGDLSKHANNCKPSILAWKNRNNFLLSGQLHTNNVWPVATAGKNGKEGAKLMRVMVVQLLPKVQYEQVYGLIALLPVNKAGRFEACQVYTPTYWSGNIGGEMRRSAKLEAANMGAYGFSEGELFNKSYAHHKIFFPEVLECSALTLPKLAKSGDGYFHLDTFARNLRETFVQQTEEHHAYGTDVIVDMNAWTHIMFTEAALFLYGRQEKKAATKYVKDEATIKAIAEQDEKIIKENFHRLKKNKPEIKIEEVREMHMLNKQKMQSLNKEHNDKARTESKLHSLNNSFSL